MKKTVSINISGVIFNIDEDAYAKLQNYLETIRGYFSNSEGCDEIMADIEARIAEMFSEKVTTSNQVITLSDVEEAISIMGQPEEYLDEETLEGNGNKKQKSQRTSSRGSKRIYRDSDGKVIGGVCSGLGYYFGIDPLWLRITFVGLFFLGGGIIIYIILWLIIPKATTTAEKLAMKGESVNVNNIGKAVEEEMDNLKDRLNDMAADVKNSDIAQKTKGAFDKFFDFVINLFTLLINAVGKIIGMVFMIAGIIVLAAFLYALISKDASIASWTSDGWIAFSFSELLTAIFSTNDQAFMATVGIILVIGVPLVSIVYSGIKLLFNIRNDLKVAGIILTASWLAGIVICGIVFLQLASDFSKKETTEIIVGLEQPTGDTLHLDIGKDIFDDRNIHYDFIPDRDVPIIRSDEGKIYFGNPRLDIIRSETDSFEVVMIKSAKGASKKQALNRARGIQNKWEQSSNSISINPWFEVDATDNWRSQELEIIVKVPEGKAVYLSDDIDRIIYDINNVSNTWDKDMTGKTWTMLEEGLTCVGCNEDEL